MVLCTVKAPTTYFSLFIAVFLCIAAWEWSRLIGISGITGRLLYVLFVVFLISVLLFSPQKKLDLVIVFLGMFWWLYAIRLVIDFHRGKKHLLNNLRVNMVYGIFILFPAWLSLVMLHQERDHGLMVLELFILIWLADSAAYIFGKCFGKHHMTMKISPGKTWEGVFGALLTTAVITIVYQLVTLDVRPGYALVILTIITVSFSILGDLVESIFKRNAGVKDSGSIFPGHGGVLDRIDSLTAAAPIYFAGHILMEQTK